MVHAARNLRDEQAFLQLKQYLEFYIKLFGAKYRISGCDSDEIEQECLFALRYKAIEDFNAERGKFRSFAILCIRRHLFSIIKGNNQLKRRPLNESLSLDQDRSDDGENLSLINLVTKTVTSADSESIRSEENTIKLRLLFEELSTLEEEVVRLYIKQMTYDEMVVALRAIFPGKDINSRTIDNSLCRSRQKGHKLAKEIDWNE